MDFMVNPTEWTWVEKMKSTKSRYPQSLKHGKNPSNSTLESLTHTLYIAHGLQMTDWHLLEIDQLRINCRYSIHGLDSIPNRTGTHTHNPIIFRVCYHVVAERTQGAAIFQFHHVTRLNCWSVSPSLQIEKVTQIKFVRITCVSKVNENTFLFVGFCLVQSKNGLFVLLLSNENFTISNVTPALFFPFVHSILSCPHVHAICTYSQIFFCSLSDKHTTTASLLPLLI